MPTHCVQQGVESGAGVAFRVLESIPDVIDQVCIREGAELDGACLIEQRALTIREQRIQHQAGGQFDPELVRLFLPLLEREAREEGAPGARALDALRTA
jgi:hypothetical protein